MSKRTLDALIIYTDSHVEDKRISPTESLHLSRRLDVDVVLIYGPAISRSTLREAIGAAVAHTIRTLKGVIRS